MSGGGGLCVPGGARRPRPRSPLCLFTWRLGDVTGRAGPRGRCLVPRCTNGVMYLKLQTAFTYLSFERCLFCELKCGACVKTITV